MASGIQQRSFSTCLYIIFSMPLSLVFVISFASDSWYGSESRTSIYLLMSTAISGMRFLVQLFSDSRTSCLVWSIFYLLQCNFCVMQIFYCMHFKTPMTLCTATCWHEVLYSADIDSCSCSCVRLVVWIRVLHFYITACVSVQPIFFCSVCWHVVLYRAVFDLYRCCNFRVVQIFCCM